ncbi:uncharacterized protein BDV14DRAFT_165887 [Aspergillus stella-maris]|uniref:uncharacterized protein n=1 Tax=Aspergillus stella-maris TaxID=1810926 RepID=UPI003CCD09F9
MQLLTLFTTLLATAGVVSAMPSVFNTQISCIGLNDRRCDNSTINFTCCPPLTCGSDARCH